MAKAKRTKLQTTEPKQVPNQTVNLLVQLGLRLLEQAQNRQRLRDRKRVRLSKLADPALDPVRLLEEVQVLQATEVQAQADRERAVQVILETLPIPELRAQVPKRTEEAQATQRTQFQMQSNRVRDQAEASRAIRSELKLDQSSVLETSSSFVAQSIQTKRTSSSLQQA